MARMMDMLRPGAMGALAVVGTLALSAPASAVPIAQGAFGGGGASAFGLNDMGGTAFTCALCDSAVNFVGYRTTSGGNWVDELGLAGLVNQVGNRAIDATARFVLFYQIANTNPLGGANDVLENFNVTVTNPTGGPVSIQPYTSGGFLTNSSFGDTFSLNPPLDTPNDQTPAETGAKTISAGLTGVTNVAPNGLSFSDDAPFSSISSPAIASGTAGYLGALFTWDANNNIAANAFSEVLFLTTDYPVDYVWAETESPGGFGAAGDVIGVNQVPLPGSIMLLIPALAGLAFLGRRRRAAA